MDVSSIIFMSTSRRNSCATVDYRTHGRLLLLILFATFSVIDTANDYPWTYDNDLFGGPDFWGLLSKNWRMCTQGLMQSPIDIQPAQLLFDPHLTPLQIDKHSINAILENLGQLPMITVINASSATHGVNITGGALTPYRYRLHHLLIHYGRLDDDGSEHTIDGVRFPAEIQLLAYNSDLYANFSDAMVHPRGIAAISAFVQMGAETNAELHRITVAARNITYRGMSTRLTGLNPLQLLPHTEHYVTYDGSLTYPGCYETVIWTILNNPLYLTRDDLEVWNLLQQTDKKSLDPVYAMPNHRPMRDVNGRLVRTNINIKFENPVTGDTCPISMRTVSYRSNTHSNRLSNTGVRLTTTTTNIDSYEFL